MSGERERAVWGAIELELPAASSDELVAVAGPVCLGAEVRPSAAGGERLVLYFASEAAATAHRARLEAALGTLGLDRARVSLELHGVPDGAWVESYQAGLRPLELGRFVVDPTGTGRGLAAKAPERERIALVPGRAFGTGEHATTRLCAAALERRVRPGSLWVDLGCGSGILSVVACLSGAVRVLALDHDPEAVAVARDVARENGLASRIEVEQGSLAAARGGVWDGVVANIDAAFLVERAAELARLPRGGGLLVVAGFLAGERADVLRALAAAGLAELGASELEGWAALELRADGGAE